jgi:hypothetical protein
MKTERTWTWREAGPADREAQCRLFNTCFRKNKQVDTFVWKYEQNPHGPAVSRVALDGSGRVVGAYSYVPRRFRRDGKRIVLMQASDAMVDPDARRQGIFTGLDDVVSEASAALGIPWAFAYSGRLSYNGFLGNGWKDIGKASVYRYRYRSERGLRRMGRIGSLAACAAPLLDLNWSRRDRRRFDSQPSRLIRMERFERSVDELCEAAIPARGLFGERDAEWLNWRYVDSPSSRQECYILPGQASGELLDGYLVVEFHAGHAFLVDHQARSATARHELLRSFSAMAYQRGVHEATALLFDHNPAAKTLLDLGWQRPEPIKLFRDMFPFIVRACRSDAGPEDEEIGRWHLADGDRDAELMSA